MTIPRPAFILVDDCPGWCTFDHDKLSCEPGDHEAVLIELGDGHHHDSVTLLASADNGLEVSVSIEGDEALRMPITGAHERLILLARMALTAVYRLDVIEDCEDSVSGEDKANLSYSLDFGSELLTLKQATQVLQMADPHGFASEVTPTLA